MTPPGVPSSVAHGGAGAGGRRRTSTRKRKRHSRHTHARSAGSEAHNTPESRAPDHAHHRGGGFAAARGGPPPRPPCGAAPPPLEDEQQDSSFILGGARVQTRRTEGTGAPADAEVSAGHLGGRGCGRDGFRGGSCGERNHAGGSEATLEARVKVWRYFIEWGPRAYSTETRASRRSPPTSLRIGEKCSVSGPLSLARSPRVLYNAFCRLWAHLWARTAYRYLCGG